MHPQNKMNRLSFNILPSVETNDHELRILIDNEDILGKDYLGLDPPAFFGQDNFNQNGELMIGRCTCGVEGCSDYPVRVIVNDKTISWTDNSGLNLVFEKEMYDHTITAAKNDHSWEDIKRTAERLVENILKHSQTSDHYKFNWASARIKEKQITLSYSKHDNQKLFDINWDEKTTINAENNAIKFLKEIVEK